MTKKRLISDVLEAYEGEKAEGELFEFEDSKGNKGDGSGISDYDDLSEEITVKKYCALGALMCNTKQVTTKSGAFAWEKVFHDDQNKFLAKNFNIPKNMLDKEYTYLDAGIKKEKGRYTSYSELHTVDGLAELIYTLNDDTTLTIPEIGKYLRINFNL